MTSPRDPGQGDGENASQSEDAAKGRQAIKGLPRAARPRASGQLPLNLVWPRTRGPWCHRPSMAPIPLRRPSGAVPTAGDRDACLSGQRGPLTAPLRTPEPQSTSVRLPPVGPHEASGTTWGELGLHAPSEHSQHSSTPPSLVTRLLPTSLTSQGSPMIWPTVIAELGRPGLTTRHFLKDI